MYINHSSTHSSHLKKKNKQINLQIISYNFDLFSIFFFFLKKRIAFNWILEITSFNLFYFIFLV